MLIKFSMFSHSQIVRQPLRSSKEIFVDEKVFFKVAINFFVYLSRSSLLIGLILAVFAETL